MKRSGRSVKAGRKGRMVYLCPDIHTALAVRAVETQTAPSDIIQDLLERHLLMDGDGKRRARPTKSSRPSPAA